MTVITLQNNGSECIVHYSTAPVLRELGLDVVMDGGSERSSTTVGSYHGTKWTTLEAPNRMAYVGVWTDIS